MEQKYAELKVKYNDLVSKHMYLVAQKTEDNRTKGSAVYRISDTNSQNADGAYPQTVQ